MRKALALSIALGVGLGLGQVMAEDAQTQVPNLVGTWTSPVKLKWMRAKGNAEGSLTLRVLDQDGPPCGSPTGHIDLTTVTFNIHVR